MEQSSPATNKKVIAIIGLLVIVSVAGVTIATTKKDSSSAANQQNSSASTAQIETAPDKSGATPTPGSSTTNESAYADGTYTATGHYDSPGGHEGIEISLTVKNGAVTGTNAVSEAISRDGREFQADFIANYKSQVIGKDLSSLRITHVSGSSLTPKGFNDAVAQIQAQAKKN